MRPQAEPGDERREIKGGRSLRAVRPQAEPGDECREIKGGRSLRAVRPQAEPGDECREPPSSASQMQSRQSPGTSVKIFCNKAMHDDPMLTTRHVQLGPCLSQAAPYQNLRAGQLFQFGLSLLFMVCCLEAGTAVGQLPTAELISLSRSGAQVGSTIELQLNGTRLEELQTLAITGDASAIAVEPRTASPRLLSDQPLPTNTFNVKIGETVGPGLVEVRGVGRFGLSNPRRMLITAKPIQIPASEHSNSTTSLALVGNEIVLDRCAAQKLSYFHLQLPVGASLQAVAYAQQLDSRAALSTRLLDANGKELARSRSIGPWPAELNYTTKEATEAYIVVHDLLYQGGGEYPFALEAVISPADAPAPPLELNQLLRPKFEAATDVAVGEVATPPFAAQGVLGDAAGGVDFVAKSQQLLSFRVTSSALEQLTDPRLVVYKVDSVAAADGAASTFKLSQLAEQDDGPTLGRSDVRVRQADPALVWTAPEDATYRAVVLDNQAGVRPSDAQQYLLAVDSVKPGFRLLAYQPFPSNNPAAARPFGSNLMRGGTEALHVLCLREDGYAGPVELFVQGLPAGISCAPMIIPANQTEATLILRANEDAAAWHGELTVSGRATISEQSVERNAEYATVVWSAVPTKNAVQHRRADNLMIAINALDVAPLLVELGDGSVTQIARGGKAPLLIKATRREGGVAECLLRPQHLPPGLALGELKIPADQSELATELTIAADAPVGEYTWWMQNETKVKFKPNPQALSREEAYLAQLQAALAAAVDEPEKQKLTETITAVTAVIEELKKQTAEQEFTVWLPTTPHRIKIVAE